MKIIAEVNGVTIVEYGYRPPRFKRDDIWYNIYNKDFFVTRKETIAEAFSLLNELSNIV